MNLPRPGNHGQSTVAWVMRVLHCQNCGKAGLAVFQASTPGRPTLMITASTSIPQEREGNLSICVCRYLFARNLFEEMVERAGWMSIGSEKFHSYQNKAPLIYGRSRETCGNTTHFGIFIFKGKNMKNKHRKVFCSWCVPIHTGDIHLLAPPVLS